MRSMGKGILAGLVVAGIAAVLFQFAWTVYGLLDDTPIEYIWGTLFILLVVTWMYYAKWVWGVLRNRYKRRPAKLPLVSTPPYDMVRLERDAHDWRLDGTPGSVAAASIGLEAIDEYLDMG